MFGSWWKGGRPCLFEAGVGKRSLVRPAGQDLEILPDLLELRGFEAVDLNRLEKVRLADSQWLSPWDATLPPGEEAPVSWWQYLGQLRRDIRTGRYAPFAIVLDGVYVGQITVSNIQRGAMSCGMAGYWVSSGVAGRGVGTAALAMVLDYMLGEVGLHRVEVNIRPENGPSLAVVSKLGLREEGLRRSYIHIAGNWADHRCFAVTEEEIPPGGFVSFLEGKCRGL